MKTYLPEKVSLKKFQKHLFIIIAGLLTLHIGTQYLRYEMGIGELLGFTDRLDVDNEMSVPTWFSQILLLGAGLILIKIATLKQKTNQIHHKKWWILGIIFVYLSVDEGSMLHETFTSILKRFLPLDGSTMLSNAWVLVAIPLLMILVIYFWNFLMSLPKPTRNGYLIAAAIFLGGAIGMEILGTNLPYQSFIYNGLDVALEEGLEMTGVAVFIIVSIAYFLNTFPKKQLYGFTLLP